MKAKRLKNGNLLVPIVGTSKDGIIGEATVEIGPDDPLYTKWEKYVEGEAEKDSIAEPDRSSDGSEDRSEAMLAHLDGKALETLLLTLQGLDDADARRARQAIAQELAGRKGGPGSEELEDREVAI